MSKQTIKLPTYEEFYQWVLNQPKDAFLGVSCNAFNCPYSKCCCDLLGIEEAEVRYEVVGAGSRKYVNVQTVLANGERVYDLRGPDNLARAIEELDDTLPIRAKVTRAYLLRILNKHRKA